MNSRVGVCNQNYKVISPKALYMVVLGRGFSARQVGKPFEVRLGTCGGPELHGLKRPKAETY